MNTRKRPGWLIVKFNFIFSILAIIISSATFYYQFYFEKHEIRVLILNAFTNDNELNIKLVISNLGNRTESISNIDLLYPMVPQNLSIAQLIRHGTQSSDSTQAFTVMSTFSRPFGKIETNFKPLILSPNSMKWENISGFIQVFTTELPENKTIPFRLLISFVRYARDEASVATSNFFYLDFFRQEPKGSMFEQVVIDDLYKYPEFSFFHED